MSSQWISVADSMPASGAAVLACYRNSAGKWRIIRAMWVAAKTCEAGLDSDIGEYDEATDCYYDPEGWYEKIDNWDEYSDIAVNEVAVSHWMQMPAPPESTP